MRDFVKHPVFQILFFGILLGLFLVLSYGSKQPDLSDKKVVINDADLAHIIAGWQRTWKRMPTREELNGLMQSYIKDEVVYREALNQGLDKNNATVKRALISQMDMLAESQAEQKTITEEAIAAYYDLRKEQFIAPAQYAFSQVYFKKVPEKQNIEMLITNWNEGKLTQKEVQAFGDATMLPKNFPLSSESTIDREFGEGFARSLGELPTGKWVGPVNSGFGTHIVFIDSSVNAAPLPLEKVKGRIASLIEYEEKEAAKEQFYTELLQQYDVIYQGLAKELSDE